MPIAGSCKGLIKSEVAGSIATTLRIIRFFVSIMKLLDILFVIIFYIE
jgi:hypothetical protein